MPTAVPPIGKAFLDALSHGETKGDYALQYGDTPGQGTITDFTQHPGMRNGHSVAGRYQFKWSTWNTVKDKLDLPDFSPDSQDKAAWFLSKQLYKKSTGGDLETDLTSGGHDAAIIRSLRSTWPSLPGGTQQVTDRATWDKVLAASTAKYAATTPKNGALSAIGDLLSNSAGGVVSSLSALLPQLATAYAAANPATTPGATTSQIQDSLNDASDSTNRKPGKITSIEINPNGTSVLTGEDLNNPNNPFNLSKNLPHPYPIAPDNTNAFGNTINAAGEAVPGPDGKFAMYTPSTSSRNIDTKNPTVNETKAEQKQQRETFPDIAPQNTSNTYTPMLNVASNAGNSSKGAAIDTGPVRTQYVKPDGTTQNIQVLPSKTAPPPGYKPEVMTKLNSIAKPAAHTAGGVKDVPTHVVVVNKKSSSIADLGNAIAGGVDPVVASLATDTGAAPLVQPWSAAPAPLIPTTVVPTPATVAPKKLTKLGATQRPNVIKKRTPMQLLPDVSKSTPTVAAVDTVNGVTQGPNESGNSFGLGFSSGSGTIATNPTKYGSNSNQRQQYANAREGFMSSWNSG